MGLLKRKEEKTEVISVRVPGSAKAELDELRQRAEAGGFDLAGSMSEAVVRIIRQIGADLREPAGTATDPSLGATAAAVRCSQADQWYRVGVIIAAWSGRRLTPPALPGRYVVGDEWHRSRQHQCGAYGSAQNQRRWKCGVGLTCCARFLDDTSLIIGMTA